MKYIPADKLIAEIERLKKRAEHYEEISLTDGERSYWSGERGSLELLASFITSLQQEPRFPQYDNIVEKVFGAGNLEGWEFREAEMLVALAKEELLKSLQQEQPQVDLEKEIDKEWAKCEPMDEGMGLESANIVNEQFDSIARHFYELGLNARKK